MPHVGLHPCHHGRSATAVPSRRTGCPPPAASANLAGAPGTRRPPAAQPPLRPLASASAALEASLRPACSARAPGARLPATTRPPKEGDATSRGRYLPIAPHRAPAPSMLVGRCSIGGPSHHTKRAACTAARASPNARHRPLATTASKDGYAAEQDTVPASSGHELPPLTTDHLAARDALSPARSDGLDFTCPHIVTPAPWPTRGPRCDAVPSTTRAPEHGMGRVRACASARPARRHREKGERCLGARARRRRGVQPPAAEPEAAPLLVWPGPARIRGRRER